jgi:hypothetical protein
MGANHDRPGAGVGLPPPVVEDLLAAERRRHLLAILAERGEPVALLDLAGQILARQEGVPRADVAREARRQLCERLFQTDLPKLTATGVVDYDSAMGTVELVSPELGERATRAE